MRLIPYESEEIWSETVAKHEGEIETWLSQSVYAEILKSRGIHTAISDLAERLAMRELAQAESYAEYWQQTKREMGCDD